MLNKGEIENCLRETIKSLDISYIDAIGSLMASFVICMHFLDDKDLLNEIKKMCKEDDDVMFTQYLTGLAISSEISSRFDMLLNEKIKKAQNP